MACTRPVVEALEKRMLLHGIGADGKQINDGDGAETGSLVVADYTDGSTGYTTSYGPTGAAPASLPSDPWTTGNKTVLYIRATYSDTPTTDPESAAAVTTKMGVVNQFILDDSFGQASLTTTVTGLIVLPQTQAYYLSHGDFSLRNDAIAAAKAANPAWDTALFDLDAVRFNGGPGNYAGQAYVGARGVWLKTSTAGVAEHEFGHNFGNWHANSWSLTDPQTVIGTGTNVEYGDPFDVMGPAGGGAQHYNVYYKWSLGWIPDANVAHVAAGGTFQLSANDLGGTVSASALYAIDVTKDARHYWLDFRQNAGWSSNPWVMNGVGLRWSPFGGAIGNSNSGTELLDTTPNSVDGKTDSYLVAGRTFDDNVSGIHITPTAMHAAANGQPPYMDVVVNLGSSAADHAPTGSVTPSALSVAPGTTVNFTANATDVDGDALAYYWDFGDKAFGTDAATASHSWGTAGQYRVRLTVSDMKGKSFSKSVLIAVGSPAVTNTIKGRVLDTSGNPVADVRVYNGLLTSDLNYREAYTDADGTYTLVNVAAGSYAMTAAKAAWNLTRADFLNNVTVTGSSQTMPNVDFTATPHVYKISGKVTYDGTVGVAGAIVTDGNGHGEPTDASGNYTFFEPLGTYPMTATKAGLTFQAGTVSINFADATRHFQANGGFISGAIAGLPSTVTATITDGIHTTTAKGGTGLQGGFWSLGPLPNGPWHVTATAPGYTLTPTGWTSPAQVAGSTSGLNFTATATAAYVLRGRITDRTQPLAGVTVSADSGSGPVITVTDMYGDFAFSALANGIYTVTPTLAGYTFTQASQPVTINNADVTNTAFVTTNVNAAPTVATPAGATPSPVTGTSTNLSVLGADADDGEAELRYTWSVFSAPPGGTATFDQNGANSSKNALATFTRAGAYVLRVTIGDELGASVVSDVPVNVAATPTFAVLTPGNPTIYPGSQQQFTATMYDQFAMAMGAPPPFAWSVVGVGSIDQNGLYTAPGGAGAYTVNAVAGAITASTSGQVANQATVAGRYVFYNNSFWDGNDPAAAPSDDGAIASDKQALLPGQTATFANYTSYDKGINGVMIDVTGLPGGSGLSAADFTFVVGNTSDTSSWLPATAPIPLVIRRGAGAGGSDRVEIVWPDGTVQKKWLQVTMLADANTGLAAADVFYFGNAVGESGDTPGNAIVDVTDEINARNNQTGFLNPPSIANVYDYTRDRMVDVTDQLVARNNQTGFLTKLVLITAPTVGAAPAQAAASGAIATAPWAAPQTDSVSVAGNEVVHRHRGHGTKRAASGKHASPVIRAPLARAASIFAGARLSADGSPRGVWAGIVTTQYNTQGRPKTLFR